MSAPETPAPVRELPALVSVLIPAFNEAGTIERQLEALSLQRYDGEWEVIVSDNGSTDDTAAIARSFADRIPGLQVVDSSDRRGPSHARNVAVRAARGDFLAFCDADDEVDEGWLAALAEAGRHADLVGGSFDRRSLSPRSAPARRNDRTQKLPTAIGFLPFSSSANLGIWTEVYEELGGWNERYAYGEDVELGWRAQLGGRRLAFAPEALVRKRPRDSLRESWRQIHRYGSVHPQLYLDFREAGLPRPSVRTALRQWLWVVTHASHLRSPEARIRWMWIAGIKYGRLRGSIRHHTLCL